MTATMNGPIDTALFTSIGELLARARDLRAWTRLGYETFEEYCATEFGRAGLPAVARQRIAADFDRKFSDARAVYFIQAINGGLVKIGVASDPIARLAEIQRMCPVPLRILGIFPGVGQKREASLHKTFAADRRHGEWFWPSPALMALIDVARAA